jgi:hypothetical protein
VKELRLPEIKSVPGTWSLAALEMELEVPWVRGNLPWLGGVMRAGNTAVEPLAHSGHLSVAIPSFSSLSLSREHTQGIS